MEKATVAVFSGLALSTAVSTAAFAGGEDTVTHSAAAPGIGTLTIHASTSPITVTADPHATTAKVTLTADPAGSEKARKMIAGTQVTADGPNLSVILPKDNNVASSNISVVNSHGAVIGYGNNISVINSPGAIVGNGNIVIRGENVQCSNNNVSVTFKGQCYSTSHGTDSEGKVKITAIVPQGMNVDVKNGVGNIVASGSLGKAKLKTEVGKIHIESTAKANLVTGTGDITASGDLGENVTAKAGTGNINIAATKKMSHVVSFL